MVTLLVCLADHFPDLYRVTDRDRHGNATPCCTQYVRLFDSQVVEQGGYVVGEVLMTEIAMISTTAPSPFRSDQESKSAREEAPTGLLTQEAVTVYPIAEPLGVEMRAFTPYTLSR
jgi:hypothetical protein